ncbi:MAG: hypothetical protein V1492_04955 [Candidatus Micrarchaeota archaeon]
MAKKKEACTANEIVDMEKANYLMASASTLITTGSIFVLAFVSALIFLDTSNKQLGLITYFLAGTLIVGFMGMVSGFEKMFLSMKYAGGLHKSMGVSKSELIYGAFGLLIAVLFVYVLGIDQHSEVLPFILGFVIALFIVFLPRQAVVNEKIFEVKTSYFYVSLVATILFTIIAAISYLATHVNYVAMPYGHIASILVLAVFVILISKISKIQFTKSDALGLAFSVFLINLLIMIVNVYLFSYIGLVQDSNYLMRSANESIIGAGLAFVLFFIVFSVDKEE